MGRGMIIFYHCKRDEGFDSEGKGSVLVEVNMEGEGMGSSGKKG
jgi:hypothetical protein